MAGRACVWWLCLLTTAAAAVLADPQTYKIVFQEKYSRADITERLTIEMVDPTDGQKYSCVIPDPKPVTEGASERNPVRRLLLIRTEGKDAPPEGPPTDVFSVLAPLDGSCMFRVRSIPAISATSSPFNLDCRMMAGGPMNSARVPFSELLPCKRRS